MAGHPSYNCWTFVLFLTNAVAAAPDWSRRICSSPRVASFLMDSLPPKHAHGTTSALEVFRNALERDLQSKHSLQMADAAFGVCNGTISPSWEYGGYDDSLNRSERHSNGRRLQTSASSAAAASALSTTYGVAAVSSMNFAYRSGPVVQNFGGMGVKGPPAEGRNPNLTFLDTPVSLHVNHESGSFLVADQGAHRVLKFEEIYKDWNTSTVVNGAAWQYVTEAGRTLRVSFRSPSSVTRDGDDVYFSDHDNSRIFRAKNMLGGVATTAQIAIIANTAGNVGMSGDCGPATLATLRRPMGLVMLPVYLNEPRKRLAFADAGNNRVRTIDITDWPFCINTTNDCTSDGSTTNAINQSTGRACDPSTGGDCGFTSTSPDMCAFRCSQLGVSNYPIPDPFEDHTLSNADLVTLFRGCDSSSGSSDAFLLECRSSSSLSSAEQKLQDKERQVPAYLRSYSMQTAFPAGSSSPLIRANEQIMGAVVHNRLMRLNSTHRNSASWGGNPGTIRVSNPVAVTCLRWGWVQTALGNITQTGMVRHGTCYLFSTSDPCSSKTAENFTAMSGNAECRPGKLSTIVGGGNPGLPANPTATAVVKSRPQSVRLANPQGLLLFNGGFHGELIKSTFPSMMLLISDTGHNRVLGYPLLPHRKKTVRFWAFFSGPQARQAAMYANDATNPWYNSGAFVYWSLAWALGQSFGWQYVEDFSVVKVSDLSVHQTTDPQRIGHLGIVASAPGPAPEFCDPDKLASDPVQPQVHLHGSSICTVSVCPAGQPNVWNQSGFTYRSCCLEFCQQTISTCTNQLGLFASGFTSAQKCNALDQIQTCYDAIEITGVAACPVDIDAGTRPLAFMEKLLVMPANGTFNINNLNTKCSVVNQDPNGWYDCDGWCDIHIADIVGADRNWTGNGTIYAMLIELQTYDDAIYHQWGADIESMVMSERSAQRQNNSYDYLVNDPTAKYGAGKRANMQITQDYGHSLGPRFWSPLQARLSLSSSIWYALQNRNNFMNDGPLVAGVVYGIAGDGTAGNSQGRTTTFRQPTGLASDKAGRVYISDSNNYRIMRMQNIWISARSSAAIAGNGYKAYNGNGNLATQTALKYPRSLQMDDVGVLHFSDPSSHSVRQLLGENWNLPCGMTDTYWGMLTTPGPQDYSTVTFWLNCRIQEVKANLLHQIVVCEACHKSPGSCTVPFLYDMFKSLCAPTMWYVRGPSLELVTLLEVPPDCDSCPKVNGCNFAEATMTWNITGNYTDDGVNDTFEMTFWLSDEAIRQGLNTLKALNSWASASSISWSNTGVAAMLIQAEASVGSTPMQSMVDQLKVLLQSRDNSVGMSLQFILLWHWYQYVVDVCVRVTDSTSVDERAIIGAQYYDKKSQVITRLFWGTLDKVSNQWNASSVTPECNLQHPNLFGYESWMSTPFYDRYTSTGGTLQMLHLRRTADNCCGMNGYICGGGEGPCALDTDCSSGLVCGWRNCLWSSSENCCMDISYNPMSAASRLTSFARQIGYPDIYANSGGSGGSN